MRPAAPFSAIGCCLDRSETRARRCAGVEMPPNYTQKAMRERNREKNRKLTAQLRAVTVTKIAHECGDVGSPRSGPRITSIAAYSGLSTAHQLLEPSALGGQTIGVTKNIT